MKKEYEELLSMMRELSKKKIRRSYIGPWGWEHDDDDMSLDEFIDEVAKTLKEKEVQENKPKMTTISDYGDHMPAEDFDECVECRAFIPDDGDGNWATATLESDLSVWGHKRPEWATHVVWYSR